LFVFSDKVLISVIIIIVIVIVIVIILNIQKKKMKKLLLTSTHLIVKYLSKFCDCFVFDDNNYKRSARACVRHTLDDPYHAIDFFFHKKILLKSKI